MSSLNPGPDQLTAANCHRAARRWQEAIALYQKVVEEQPGAIDAWVGMALCHEELGDLASVRQALINCLVQRPQTAFAYHRLGWLSYRNKHFIDATAHYLKAIHCAPSWYEPHYHAAVCLHELRRYAEANVHYQQALNCKSDLPVIWYHAAKALKDGGQLDAAFPVYQRALELQPDYAEARYSLGLLHLLHGDWLAGWEGYEVRWQGSDRAVIEHRPATILPLWQGEEVPAASGIVIYAEQGMGDSIMCFRYARRIKDRFARVKFAVPVPLVTLFQQSAPLGVEVVARIHQAIDEANYTHHIHALSLPAVFKTTPKDVPSTPYLKVSQERRELWWQRLAGEARFKVGLVWQGGKLSHAPARDMDFSYLSQLLELRDVCWISLQKDEAPAIDSSVIDWMNDVEDFAETAALVANLDLVIAVDTAVAHLAGAMGKPVWLLNRFESEWRWMRGRESTPWYPSMRIFSQPEPGDWGSVIQHVKHFLAQWLEQISLSFQNQDAIRPSESFFERLPQHRQPFHA